MLVFNPLTNSFTETAKADPRDNITMEIGDSKQTDFYPQIKLMRWDNEVNLSVRLSDLIPATKTAPETIDSVITQTSGDVSAKFYSLPAEKDHPEGAYEFEISLAKKPISNKITFSLNTKGIEFAYQPPLTAEFKIGDRKGKIRTVTETDCLDKDGKVLVHRPEHVVGSYVLYHQNHPINVIGGKLYKTGQIGIIYRPKIEDAAGEWVWGVLEIDEVNSLLIVTIPQDFLDKATYPIKHAAGLTFGYTTVGSSSDNGGLTWYGQIDEVSPAGTNTLLTISFFVYANSGEETRLGFYDDASNAPTTRLTVDAGHQHPAIGERWVTSETWNYALTASHQYWGAIWGADSAYYNSTGAKRLNYSVAALPDPAGSDNDLTSKHISVYGTYEAAGGGDVEVSAGTDALVLAGYSATVNAEISIQAGFDALAITENAADVNINVSVSATTDSLAITTYDAAIKADISITTGLDALSLTENAANINAEISIQANADNLTLATYDATVNAEVNVLADFDALAITEYAATVTVGGNIEVSANTDALVLTEYQSTISFDLDIQATTDTLSLTTCAASVNSGVNIQANVDALTVIAFQATIDAANNVLANSATLALTAYAVNVNSEINISATTDSLALTANPATVTLPVNISATTAALILEGRTAAIKADMNVVAGYDELVLAEFAATVTAAELATGLVSATFTSKVPGATFS